METVGIVAVHLGQGARPTLFPRQGSYPQVGIVMPDVEISIGSHGENEEAAVLIPLGYPADEPKEKKRKSMEEIAG